MSAEGSPLVLLPGRNRFAASGIEVVSIVVEAESGVYERAELRGIRQIPFRYDTIMESRST